MPSEAAQSEFDALFAVTQSSSLHPEDRAAATHSSTSHSTQNSDSESSASHRARGRAIRSTGRPEAESEDDSGRENNPTANGTMRSRYFLPSFRFDANTGPKGVIADAQAYEDAKRTRGFGLNRRSRTNSPAPITTLPHTYQTNPVDDLDDKSSGDSDEESFMARWRQSRLRELQAKHRGGRRASPSKRHYGSLVSVDAEGYLDAIEKVHRDTVVVVYIYDDASEVSQSIEQCVRDLARQHSTTRFVKLHYEEAEMESAGVPALLAYRGGDKFAGLVPVVDELPDDAELSAATLEGVLKRHRILEE